jgi:hypothetical protein
MGRVSLQWNSLDQDDPGPCIDVIVMNSRDVLQAYDDIGLECPKPIKMKALLDTGASITVISKTYANYCKLRQTGDDSEISAIGATHRCGEHAGAISFPDTNLKSFDSIRIRSVDFVKQPNYAILIGRDILRNWTITFDGPSRQITIID